MPLSITLNRSNEPPSVTPFFDGRELNINPELVSAGLSAISIKGYEAGDPKEEISIRHRNSFWSVHRPELSKLNWASNHTPKNIENYLKVQAENHYPNKEFEESAISYDDSNQLNVIHANSDQQEDPDENFLLTPKPQTIQLSDDDLESQTALHKSRAEFCVTIGHVEKHSISDSSEPSGSKIVQKDSEGMNLFFENNRTNTIGLRSYEAKIETVFPPFN